jgi:hypothetical protein
LIYIGTLCNSFYFLIFLDGVLDGNGATFPLLLAFVMNDVFLQVCVFGKSRILYGKICKGYGEEN